MRILLLGASGLTGREVLGKALEEGHMVRAAVRNPLKIDINHKNLEVIKADILNEEDIKKLCNGQDAVISTLGMRRKSQLPWSKLTCEPDMLSRNMTYLVSSMIEFKVNRLILLSAAGVGDSVRAVPFWFRWLVEHSTLKLPYLDHERQEKITEKSGLNYTIVRPTGLVNGKNNKAIKVYTDQNTKVGLIITRQNVARFVLSCLQNEKLYRQKVLICQ